MLAIAAYGLQLVVAGATDEEAAYRMLVATVRPRYGHLVPLTPFLHASHAHLVGNVAALLVAGTLVERRVGARALVAFVWVTGTLANLLPSLLGASDPGVGLSGATFGLSAYVGVAYLRVGMERVGTAESLRGHVRVVATLVAGALGLFYTTVAVAQFLGVVPSGPGVSVASHVVGVVAGVGFCAWWEPIAGPRAR